MYLTSNRKRSFDDVDFPLSFPPIPEGWMTPVMPEEPTDFRKTLPKHPGGDHLSVTNGHQRDKNLRFEAATHSYFIKGQPSSGSVTSLIHEFVEEFNPDSVIDKMVSGNNWPRPGYLRNVIPVKALETFKRVPAASLFLRQFHQTDRDERHLCELMTTLRAEYPCLTSALDEVTLSREEIYQKWDNNRVESANRGTWMHLCFEMFLNGVTVDEKTAEFRLFRKFLQQLSGWTTFRTEWTIYGDEENLAGSIDFVAIDSTNRLLLVDWKRSKELRRKYEGVKNMLSPLNHIPDVPGWHYRLQLNCYAYLIEKYYGYVVARMLVVCLHPDNGEQPFVDSVPRLDKEVDEIMSLQRLFARRRVIVELSDSDE